MIDLTEAIDRDEAARHTIKTELGRTLFVEAGAGSGKTTALVGRIVELVLTPGPEVRKPLSQIAAITFTEAAAAELRERVRAKFEEERHIARVNGRAEIVERCEQALADADIAAISTLHSFAQRLLSEFPVEVRIPPRVEVVDEVRSLIAFERRWSQFLDELYADPTVEEFIVRASILGVGLNSTPIRNIAQAFDDNWDRLLNIPISLAKPRPIDTAAIREKIHEIRSLVSECQEDSDLLLGQIRDAEATFRRFGAATTEHEQLRMVRRLKGLKFGRRAGKAPNWDDVDHARTTCSSLAEVCEDVLGDVTTETLQRLSERIAEFTRRSAEERRAEGVLEFHDLLVLAHLLLRESPEARASLSDRYQVLMLDEFQDTDPIQIGLAMLLAASVEGTFEGNWNDLSPVEGRLFLVGDPKQSIYRFRRADIGVFLQAQDKFADGEVVLQRNFRTVPPIIDMVNAFFAGEMPENTESQAAYTPLVPARSVPSGRDHRPIVFGGPLTVSAREIREVEAADVAATIVDIKDNPQNWQIFDRDQERWRDPLMSDVTILLPTRTSMSQLSHALDDRGIPFRADTGTLVYETQEVRDVLSVLRAIDDATNHIALTAALRSPLYGCGYDDLYAFVAGGGSLDLQTHIPDELVGGLVAQGIEHLRDLARRRWWDEPSALLQRVIDERFAMALPAAGRRARDTWRRLRYVVDQARAFAEAGGGDLRSYLAWTDLQGADGARAHEPMLAEPDDDAVQIMTIHGSKGLEFPITIVSGMTTTHGGGRPVGQVLWAERDGELPQVKVSSNARTEFFDPMLALDEQMEAPERTRLLYVALTRARDHLVVSGYHRLKKGGDPYASHGQRIHQWANGEGAELTRELLGQGSLFVAGSNSERQRDRSVLLNLESPTDWTQRQQSRLALASRRSVTSATALARRAGSAVEDDGPDPLAASSAQNALPPLQFRRGRAGSSIGSAVHGVLQILDLTDPQDSAIDDLSEAQAWAESVPEHVETIRHAVDSALMAPIVAACKQYRHWKELFVATPVGSVTIEGYVDLLVETPEGLVVVDYKTDSVADRRGVEAKLAHYRLQGAAYAVAVANATGRAVIDVQFVFCRPGEPIVASIPDLDAAREEVIAVADPPGQTAIPE